MKFDVYLAAPFFSLGERLLNDKILKSLEDESIKVFYPPRDGIVAKNEISDGAEFIEITQQVWKCDTDAIIASKVVLAVLDGRSIDEGVCVEIGYAAALSKTVIGYQNDDRTCFNWGNNPMIIGAISVCVSEIKLAVNAVKKYSDVL